MSIGLNRYFILFWVFFCFLASFSYIKAMEEPTEKPRRSASPLREMSEDKRIDPLYSLFREAFGDEEEDFVIGDWVILMPPEYLPRQLWRDWEFLSKKDGNANVLVLDAALHFQPGPTQCIFALDLDPNKKPYFSYDGLSSSAGSSAGLTPLSLWMYSDPTFLEDTGQDPTRAVASLRTVLTASHALDDLEKDREVEDRVYNLDAERIQQLGKKLLTKMLIRLGRADRDLENTATLALIARTAVLDILKRIGYDKDAIKKLNQLETDLKTNRVTIYDAPKTYEELLSYANEAPAASSEVLAAVPSAEPVASSSGSDPHNSNDIISSSRSSLGSSFSSWWPISPLNFCWSILNAAVGRLASSDR